jgi:hypothetical protein
VVAAFFDFGLRNAGTPLLIASTPVSAALPEENARNTRNTSASPERWSPSSISWKSALSAGISWPSRNARVAPQITMAKMPTTNA